MVLNTLLDWDAVKKKKLSKLFRYVESLEETKYRLFLTKDMELFKNIMKYGVTLVALLTLSSIKFW